MKKVLMVLLLSAVFLGVAGPVVASTGTVHVVQPGQTLTGIARWYGVDLWTLARANGIVNPNRIYVGQRLVIPTGGAITPIGGTYIVRPGDTMYSIAQRYGLSVWTLAQANSIYNLQLIYVGQRLVIPGAAPAPAPAPPPAPAPAPTTGWRGEYYVGETPSGGPQFVRTDRAINFHWGSGGPDSRVGVDNFSVHWTRTILFKGGVYRFTATSDDGVRVWVDGQIVMDEWRIQPETTFQVDVVLSPGKHVIAVDYFENDGVATIQFGFVRLGDGTVVITTPVPTAVATPSQSTEAWYGQYFNNETLSGSPAATRYDGAIGFEWKAGPPIGGVGADHFSVRWTRSASFYADNYAFCAMSDDGVRIYVDGQLLVDEWHPSNSVAYCKETSLTAGNHQVQVDYYESGGNALIYVWWERR